MSTSLKLNAGESFPTFYVMDLNGDTHKLGKPKENAMWQLVVIYRGRHCPLCTKYLNHLESYRERLMEVGVDIIAVSADSKEQLQAHLPNLSTNFTLAYGLTLEAMQTLGTYISIPRSAEETDHNFPEPALFIINEDFNIHVVDYSNNPFVRPELESLVSGVEWIKNPDNHYPIRGTYVG